MKVLNYFNSRTLLALVISQVAAFIAIRYQIKFNTNLMLFSLAVAFPLHYTIQAAFKRRDRAIEFLGRFKASLMALHYSIQIAEDLTPELKLKGTNLLKDAFEQLADQLEARQANYFYLQKKLSDVSNFIDVNQHELSKRNAVKMIRYLGAATESSANLLAQASHRTIIGMRFYSVFFILIFPLVQAPIILHKLEDILPVWGLYAIVATTSVILITLNNFQKMIEYPFDPDGPDNIQLKEFKLDV